MAGPFHSSREVILRTPKWTDAVSFYGSILGLPIAYQDATIVGFETGAFRLYVENGKEHAPVFELLVPDVEAAKRRLLAAGCIIIEEDPALPRCYIRDPFGFTFNLGQAPAPKV
ncbi:MAG TPA: VOC family protein [Planctomycetaceae bacterium]|jgi:catechol 2,3-dioxygenase-like lactoylglutathione lyase family enzyme|nr:VOC family protein [Planctomycetaceae bacterium]